MHNDDNENNGSLGENDFSHIQYDVNDDYSPAPDDGMEEYFSGSAESPPDFSSDSASSSFADEINIRPWTAEREFALSEKLVDFVSSFRFGNPTIDRDGLIRGLGAELEAPFDHKIMNAVYDMSPHRNISGYNELVAFFTDLGYGGFPDHEPEDFLDMSKDLGPLTAEDNRLMKEYVSSVTEIDPEMSQALDSAISAGDAIEAAGKEGNEEAHSTEALRFFSLVADKIKNQELPPIAYDYVDGQKPEDLVEKYVDEYKQSKSFLQNDSKSDSSVNDLAKGGKVDGSKGSNASASKVPGDAKKNQQFPKRSAKTRAPMPYRPMYHDNFHDIAAKAIVGIVSLPFLAASSFRRSPKSAYNVLLNSKIKSLSQAESVIEGGVNSLVTNTDSRGNPLSDSQRKTIEKKVSSSISDYKSNIAAISNMAENRNSDDRSDEKVFDAIKESSSFLEGLKAKNLESLGEFGNKIKEFCDAMTKFVSVMVRLFSRSKTNDDSSPGSATA